MSTKKKASPKPPAKLEKPRGAAEKKERAPRKPALERASRLAGQIDKKVNALTKNTDHWTGPATPEQLEEISSIRQNLTALQHALEAVDGSLAFLTDTKYTPKGAAPGRKPIQAGAAVMLKEKRYEAGLHGPNDFEVVAAYKNAVQLRSRGNPRAMGFHVPRSWIMLNSEAEEPAAEDLDDEGTT